MDTYTTLFIFVFVPLWGGEIHGYVFFSRLLFYDLVFLGPVAFRDVRLNRLASMSRIIFEVIWGSIYFLRVTR